jgi:hypothetical protein
MKKTIVISLIVSNLLFGANSTVTNMTTEFTNTINGTSEIDNSTVNQGKTSITESTVTNVDLKSTGTHNTISGTKIKNESKVDQSTFIINKSSAVNGDANTANDARQIKISSENTIDNSNIDKSIIRQNYTSIDSAKEDGTAGSAVTVTILDVVQKNTIENTKVDDPNNDSDTIFDIKNATISQGEFTFRDGSQIQNLSQANIENKITNSSANDATMKQNSITVDNSTVNNFTTTHNNGGTEDNTVTNLIENTTASATGDHKASITQNTATFKDSSNIANSDTEQSNAITGLTLTGASVVQGNIEVNHAEVKDFDTKFVNSINEVTIDSSDGTHKVEQGVLKIGGTDEKGTKVSDLVWDSTESADATHIDIVATNKLENSDLDDSNVAQSKTAILEGSTVSGLTLDHTNNIVRVTADSTVDNTLNLATISQAETEIQESTVAVMKQIFTNNILSSEIKENSSLSQGHTKITNSDVSNLEMTQTNKVEASTISGSSTVTQGSTIIEGTTAE